MDLQVDTSIEQSHDFTGMPGVDTPGMGAVASPSSSALSSPTFEGTGLAAPQFALGATPTGDALPSLKRTGTAGGVRSQVVAFAKQFLGTPYVWGGTSPRGFDCSGLTQYVTGSFGVKLPRVSYQQANYGKRVSLGSLKPGDLVAWDNSSRNNGADHIALYIGNGYILEAPRAGVPVRIRKLGSNEGAWGVHLKYPGE